jgi:sugar phosphate isomerase/epimerase
MKVGLYSITYLGLWYRGEALPLPALITRAKEYGYDGIEIDGKRPHGNPLDWPTPRCRELRSLAEGEGIDIFAVAANNDFSNPVPEVREAQICFMRDLIRMTADLGAPTLRVFLAWWGVTAAPALASYDIAALWPVVHEPFSPRDLGLVPRGADRVRPLRRATPASLALQNHRPVIHDHHDVRVMSRSGLSLLKSLPRRPLMPDRSQPPFTRRHARSAAASPVALRRRIRAAQDGIIRVLMFSTE